MNKLIVCIVFLAVAAHALPTDTKEKRDIYYTSYGTGLGMANMPVVLGNIMRPIVPQQVVSVVRPVVQQPVVLSSGGLSGYGINTVNGVLGGRTVIRV